MGVAVCLQRDPLPTATIEAPMKPMHLEIMAENLQWLQCALATLFKMRPKESPSWIQLLPAWEEWPSGVPPWWPALPDPP